MENREVVDIIAEATNKKWFDEKKVVISYPIIGKKISFDSFIAFYNYITKQLNIQLEISDFKELPTPLQNFHRQFETLRDQIHFFVVNFANSEETELEKQWSSLIQIQISSLVKIIPLDSILFDSLTTIARKNKAAFDGAYNYSIKGIVSESNRSVISKEILDGILEVYSATKGEKLHSNLLNNKIKELEVLNQKFENKIAETEVKLTDYLAASSNKYKEYTKEIDEYKSTKQTEVNTWLEETKTGFSTFDETSKSKIADLEKTYSEKLKLAAPAQYWKERSEKLYKEGRTAMYWLIGLVAVACILLYILLWQTPEGMLTSIFNGDRSKAIRWSIVFITFISFLAVGFRMLSKLMFSAFHLSRDAEEREQLSYFYLALIKEGAVEKEDRHLIMQSLFSRADSGLLKEDSSPTMPGGMLDKIITR